MEQECFGSPDYKTLFIFYTCISLLKVASVKKKKTTLQQIQTMQVYFLKVRRLNWVSLSYSQDVGRAVFLSIALLGSRHSLL